AGSPGELAGAETFVAGRRLPSVVQGLPRIPHGEPRGAPPDSPAAPHPGLRRHALELVERTVEASGERVDAIPDLVVQDVPGDEPIALVQGLRVAAIEEIELVGGAEVPDRDKGKRPDALEVGRHLNRDPGGALGRLAATPVVELEGVDARD